MSIASHQSKVVVFISTGLTYGGAETQIVSLAVKFKHRGWDVKVVTMIPPVAFVDELTECGIPVQSLNMSRGVPDPRAIFRLVRLIRKWRPLVVHSHMVHANLLSRITRLFVKMPVLICTAHNIDEGGKWREIGYRVTERLCNITTNVSQAAVERYILVGAATISKIVFIPNGVDLNKFTPNERLRHHLRQELELNENSFVWLAVGRLEKEKNYPLMLSAFSHVVNNHPNALLMIVGQGTLRLQLEKLCEELGIKQYVRFLGVRKDVPLLMNAADSYVLSSDLEGLPMVLLEASASGLPAIATRVGGNQEVILHEKSGLLTKPGDSHDLSIAMMRFMSMPKVEFNSMRIAAISHVAQNYNLTQITDKWEAMYLNFLMAQNM